MRPSILASSAAMSAPDSRRQPQFFQVLADRRDAGGEGRQGAIVGDVAFVLVVMAAGAAKVPVLFSS